MLAGISACGKHPASHHLADRMTGAALDQNGTAVLPARGTRIRGTGQIAGVTTNVNRAARQFATQVIADISGNLNGASAHAAAHVMSGIALNLNPAGLHLMANPVDPLQITGPDLMPFAGLACYTEQVSQFR